MRIFQNVGANTVGENPHGDKRMRTQFAACVLPAYRRVVEEPCEE